MTRLPSHFLHSENEIGQMRIPLLSQDGSAIHAEYLSQHTIFELALLLQSADYYKQKMIHKREEIKLTLRKENNKKYARRFGHAIQCAHAHIIQDTDALIISNNNFIMNNRRLCFHHWKTSNHAQKAKEAGSLPYS